MRLPSTSTAVRVIAVLLAALVVGTVVLVVMTVRRGGEAPSAPAEPAITTLAQLARADPAVPRGAFCDRVAVGAVEDALGGQVASVRDYQNGDTAQVDPTTNDVAHEFGCTWTSTDGAVARAWVFAPPITRARAAALSRSVPAAPGCAAYDAAGFGTPTTAFTCTGSGLVSAGHGGLFGDAWLSCTLAEPTGAARVDVEARADRWCVGVAVGAASPARE